MMEGIMNIKKMKRGEQGRAREGRIIKWDEGVRDNTKQSKTKKAR